MLPSRSLEIFAACPFAVSTLAWEPAPGRRSVCVCVKATFVLVAGGVATIATVQDPIGSESREVEPGTLGELCPFKPRADILLIGGAHAPRATPVETLIARARVGSFRKSLNLTGDRTWVPSFDGLRASAPTPFRRMPLRYERAVRAGENAGGIDIIAQGAELNKPLPNIAAIADQGGETPGFGPLPLTWRARRSGAGDAALMWASRVAVLAGPPPSGFDFRLFNVAPAEQQVDEIPAGIDIALENLHPDHAWLETRLPALRVKLFRQAPRSDRVTEMPVRCDTLTIDTDRGLCSVVWRGAVLIEGAAGDEPRHIEAAVGRLVIAVEGEGERIGPEHADRLLAQLAPQVTYVESGPAFGLPPRATPPSYPPAALPPPRAPTPMVPRTEDPRPPRAAPTVAGGLPFRAPPTGFEGAPVRARDSYPPPPPPPGHGLSPHPPPPGTLPPAAPGRGTLPPAAPGRGTLPPAAPLRPPSYRPPDDDGEATPPRGFAPTGSFTLPAERTTTGTLVPPAPELPAFAGYPLPPPHAGGGTIRPPPSAPPTTFAPPPVFPSGGLGMLADPTPPAAPSEPQRTAGGTLRPQPAEPPEPPSVRTRPTLTPPVNAILMEALPFMRAPEPSLPEPPTQPSRTEPPAAQPTLPSRTEPPAEPRAASEPPADPAGAIDLALWCAVKTEAWARATPIEEVLARRGLDEGAFRAFERAQEEIIAREAAEGRADRATAVMEALRVGRQAPEP